MKNLILTILGAASVLSACAPKQESMTQLQKRVFKVAAEQVKITDARLGEKELPRSIKDGQAWGLYGYTMMFRESADSTYLRQLSQLICPFLFSMNNPAYC